MRLLRSQNNKPRARQRSRERRRCLHGVRRVTDRLAGGTAYPKRICCAAKACSFVRKPGRGQCSLMSCGLGSSGCVAMRNVASRVPSSLKRTVISPRMLKYIPRGIGAPSGNGLSDIDVRGVVGCSLLLDIGRVRARRLFFNRIKDIKDLKNADLMKLSQILGKQVALSVKKQVGEEIKEVPIGRRKGQVSLEKY